MKNDNGNNSTEAGNEPEVSRGFRFRVVMTLVFFVLALVYIIWLLKII